MQKDEIQKYRESFNQLINGVTPNNKRAELLESAKQCVCRDRNAQYGEPEDNFGIISKLWSDYLGIEVTSHDVGLMMTLFKIARIKSGGVKDDNYIDAAGYIACAGEIALKGGVEQK